MFKSGFVTIIGRPNAGKSTLMNTIVGEKVAIVTWRPQTTRDKIVGIKNAEGYQIVFLDTPGIHDTKNSLSELMMKRVDNSLRDKDCVLYLSSMEKPIDNREKDNIEKYSKVCKNFILVLTKIDLVTNADILERINEFGQLGVENIIPLSANKKINISMLEKEIVKILPEGEAFYPEDLYTDKSVRFMVGEIIREKAMKFLSEEVPYGIGVSIEKFKEREDGLSEIDAVIICEKKAHKPIIIGKGGSMLKKIASYAREDIEKLIDGKVFLTCWVKIKEEWRDNLNIMRELGYDIKSEE